MKYCYVIYKHEYDYEDDYENVITIARFSKKYQAERCLKMLEKDFDVDINKFEIKKVKI